MNLIKKNKISYRHLIITVVIVAGSLFLMYKKTTAQDIHIDTSDWKTWAWDATCGDFDIKYSPSWHVQLRDSGELGCNGTISHFPADYHSLDKANEGIVIRFSYSKTSAVSETTAQKIEEKIINLPGKSFFPSILRCTETKDTEQNFLFIECYTTRNNKVYIISSDIKNDSENMYANQVSELLKSFKLNN